MSEYTPTTEEIRDYIEVGPPQPWEQITAESKAVDAKRVAAFDRWLAAHDEQVRAEQREADAQIAESKHNVGWSADRPLLTARYPDNGSAIAAAIRAVPANTNTEEDH